jgi:hypothetical protein
MKEAKRSISALSVPRLFVLCLAVICAVPAWAQQGPSQPQVLSNAVANEPIRFDVSRPLAELVTKAPAQQGVRVIHAPMKTKPQPSTGAQLSRGAEAAGALQPLIGPLISATTGLSFEGGRTSWRFL